LVLLIDCLNKNNISYWKKYLYLIFLGIALSSRGDLLLMLPIFFSYLIQNIGLRKSVEYILTILIAFMIVTLPFYLYDPFGFTPLIVQLEKIMYSNPVLNLNKIILIVAFCILVSVRTMKNNTMKFFESVGIILLIPSLLAFITLYIEFKELDVSYLTYSYGSYVFILLTYFLRIIEKNKIAKS
jgi:uncharacterized membrane protein